MNKLTELLAAAAAVLVVVVVEVVCMAEFHHIHCWWILRA